jgi:hypothetical protein
MAFIPRLFITNVPTSLLVLSGATIGACNYKERSFSLGALQGCKAYIQHSLFTAYAHSSGQVPCVKQINPNYLSSARGRVNTRVMSHLAPDSRQYKNSTLVQASSHASTSRQTQL